MTSMTKLTSIAAAALLLASGSAFAKAHNQGNTEVPGESVGTETAGPAQTLGSAKGQRPADKTPDCPGNSCSAGAKE